MSSQAAVVRRTGAATLLWRFRLASLGTQAVLWTTMGLLFGALTERSLQERRRQQAAPAAR